MTPQDPTPAHHVLLVDDNDDCRELFQTVLTGEGFRITQARTGAQALAACVLSFPDIVVLDIILPDVDGVELATKIVALAASPAVAILVVTATRLTPQELRRLKAAGANTLLYKPCEPAVLLDAVRRICNAYPIS